MLETKLPAGCSCMPRRRQESYHEVIINCPPTAIDLKGGNRIIVKGHQASSIRLDTAPFYYPPCQQVGKATTQLGRLAKESGFMDGDAQVYDRWAQAIASTHDLVVKAGTANTLYNTPYFFSATIPVMVVPDGTLWVANHTDNGVLTKPFKQVREVSYFVGKEYSVVGECNYKHTISHLHIYTLDAFTAFINTIIGGGQVWDVVFDFHRMQVKTGLKLES